MKLHTHPSRLIGLLVFTALLASVSPAMAQQADANGADPSVATNAKAGDKEADKPKADPNDPDYWAKTRDIYTVEKRPFQKQGRFSATVYGGIIPNNIFEQYYPAGVRLDYYWLENIGLELAGSYAFKSDTGLSNTITDQQGANAQQILIGDTQVFHTNFGVLWSPFYGKTAFYNSALDYFDLYVFGGAGLVVTKTPSDFNAKATSNTNPEGVLGAGAAFYLGKHATVRADFRQFVFQKVTGGVANPSEVSLGLGWFF